jgi:hypothetical protein
MTVADEILLCGNGCGHNHNSPNGPSGCCAEHGPYLYYCPTCHEKWRDEHPEQVAKIARLTRPSHRVIRPGERA